MTDSESQKPDIDVFLVHGTFAPGAAWTQPDSQLSQALAAMQGSRASITADDWSGKNREKERWKATESLKERLRSSDADLKVVVGHSHGGNIGVLALHGPSNPDEDFGARALVTLNTPFIVPARRSVQVTVLHAVLLCLALATWINAAIDQHLGLVASVFSPILAVLCVALLVSIILWGVPGFYSLFRLRPIEAPWLLRLLSRPTTDRTTRVLCVATADDEALGWLQAIEMALNVPFLLLHRIALPVVLIGIGLAHFFMQGDFTRFALADFALFAYLANYPDLSLGEWIAAYWARPPLGADVDAETVASLSRAIWDSGDALLIGWLSVVTIIGKFIQFWGVLAVGGLFGTYLLGAAAFGTGLGYRSFLAGFFVRMRVSPVPIGFSHVEFVEIDPAKSGWLRHSNAYNDPKVAATVEHWLTEFVMPEVQADDRAG